MLVTGSATLREQVQAQGLVPVSSADDKPAAVIQGFDPGLGWKDLAEAAFAVSAGAVWVATNTDLSIPQARGIAPGNGTLVAAVASATGQRPVVAGKPEAPLFTTAARHLGVERPLVVGDRLDTDILGANRANIPSVLVLTGVDKAKHVLAADKHSRPTYIVDDLRQLHEAYPATRMSRDNSEATVGDAVVRIVGNDVVVVREGARRIDLLRAACAAIWASGRAIYGFNVPEHLYS